MSAIQSAPRRIYMNFSGYNSGTTPISATTSADLSFPLLANINPNEYDLAVARFFIPLDGIDSSLYPNLMGVLVESTSLPIQGEWDQQAQFPYIVDALIDGSTIVPPKSQLLIYEPTFYRRVALIGQGMVLNRFDCRFLARWQDGSVSEIPVVPGKGWSIKVVLIRSDIVI